MTTHENQLNEGNYNEIQDPEFRRYLQNFDELLNERVTRWSMRTSYFPYARVLGLRKVDINWLLIDVRKKGIMNSATEKMPDKSPFKFDKDNSLAFAALIWTINQRYEKNTNGTTVITDSRETFPWDLVVSDTKETLGQHPLVNLLHSPNSEKTSSSNENHSEKKLITTSTLTPEIDNKFPELDEEQSKYLEGINRAAIINFCARLPRKIKGEVDLTLYTPSFMIKTVMFILMADRHDLALYDKNSDSYPLAEFRYALEKCLDYLRFYKNLGIENLYQLVDAIKTTIVKDPLKYWKVQ